MDNIAKEAREALRYDPETGNLYWRFSRGRFGNSVKAGAKAGCLHRHSGYIVVRLNGKLLKAHRLAWLLTYGEWPKEHVDHVNCDKGDNRISNLRAADHTTNKWNRRKYKSNKSGFKGVSRYRNKWQAAITANGTITSLGRFDTPEDAYAAYCEAAVRLHGDFARVS